MKKLKLYEQFIDLEDLTEDELFGCGKKEWFVIEYKQNKPFYIARILDNMTCELYKNEIYNRGKDLSELFDLNPHYDEETQIYIFDPENEIKKGVKSKINFNMVVIRIKDLPDNIIKLLK